MRDRLSLIVNRANSGIKVEDLERAIGMPTYAQVRSSGLLLVKASNEGRTLFEIAPKREDHRRTSPRWPITCSGSRSPGARSPG